MLYGADFLLLAGHLEVTARHDFTVRKHAKTQCLDILLIQIGLYLARAKFFVSYAGRRATFPQLFCYKDTEGARFAPKIQDSYLDIFRRSLLK